MTEPINILFFWTLAFVGGHFLLSSRAMRTPLEHKLGVQPYRGLYSLLALGTFAMMLLAFRDAPFVEVWSPSPALRAVPGLLMIPALILFVSSLTTPNVTLVGGERLAAEPQPVTGIMTITRHPFLWAASLWAIGHLSVNGDQASIILFGGILVLSIGGMLHIDRRRAGTLGAAWGPVALASSVIPFHAALQGRTKIDWRGIGLIRPLAGLALYSALLMGHEWIAGIALF
ncbi:NnrU family protein [Aestuariispira insulae]|nr:NnrU family protein [Aestuariispira insulae]